MTETGWQAIGRIAKLRRERLGLKQEELAAYGGPKVSTVGKFERASQERFPLRTQHQMENALGWSRTIVEQVVKSIDEGHLEAVDWEYDLVEENIPDLSQPLRPGTTGDPDLDDFNMKALTLKAVLTLVPPEDREAATNRAVSALLRFVPEVGDGADPVGLSAVPYTKEVSVPRAADEDPMPIERGQGHDENA